MQIVIDERDGVDNQDSTIVNVDKKTAISYLGRLDGQRHTLLIVERTDGTQLMVGGGEERFVVTLNDGKQSLTLLNQAGREETVHEICAGGQYGEYPETICVTRNDTAKVIDLFFEGEEMQMDWV